MTFSFSQTALSAQCVRVSTKQISRDETFAQQHQCALFCSDEFRIGKKEEPKNLIRLGIRKPMRGVNINGSMAMAQSPILVTTITVEQLLKRGYESMSSYYEKVSPDLNELLYA
jgi:hypothetical protein